MNSLLRSLALVLCLGALLGACTWREVGEVFENPRQWPNERRVLGRDWVVPNIKAKEGRVYCYRSLGAIECYPYPIAGARSRYVEDYSPIYKPRKKTKQTKKVATKNKK
ncbi:MAG: hypothetical protein ACTSUD_10510 [Alphaproteobacteria bacterium]